MSSSRKPSFEFFINEAKGVTQSSARGGFFQGPAAQNVLMREAMQHAHSAGETKTAHEAYFKQMAINKTANQDLYQKALEEAKLHLKNEAATSNTASTSAPMAKAEHQSPSPRR